MQALEQQRQQTQNQIFEIDNAVGALGESKTAFKIVGNVMVQTETAELSKELAQKKEVLEVRLQSLEKQEHKLRESAAKEE